MTGGSERLDLLLDKARFMHQKGYNCAETVLWVLSSLWHLGSSTSCATGLGGGVARMGETCGALIGAILALGLKVGRVEPDDEAKKVACYRLGQETARRFASKMGSTQCKDLIGFVLGSEGGPQRYAAGGYKDGVCRNAVEAAVKAAVEAVSAEGQNA